jgi:hypothetical protein
MKLNIFGKEYRIAFGELQSNDVGTCNHITGEIILDRSKTTHDSIEQVAFHEILHAIFDRIGARQFIEPQAEEMLCDSISKCLMDNFKLSFYLENHSQPQESEQSPQV